MATIEQARASFAAFVASLGVGGGGIPATPGVSVIQGEVYVAPRTDAGQGAADIIAAIDARIAAKNGGVIRLGNAPTNCAGRTVVLPEWHNLGAAAGPTLSVAPIDIIGTGTATEMHWPTDLGAGKFGLSCGDPTATRANLLGRYGGANRYKGLLKDVRLRGPSLTRAIGAKPAEMDGMAWGSMRDMQNVEVVGFNRGFNLVADHAKWDACVGNGNYINLYIAEPSPSLYGDITYIGCFFDGATFAAIAVHGSANLNGRFWGCRRGGSPYGIYGYEGSAALIEGSEWIGGSAEYCGNADILSAGAVRRALIRYEQRMAFISAVDDGNRLGSAARDYMIDVGRVENVTIAFPNTDQYYAPGDKGWMRASGMVGLHLDRGVLALADKCAAAGKTFITGPDHFDGPNSRWDDAGEHGTFSVTDGPLSYGQLVEQSNASIRRAPLAVGGRIVGVSPSNTYFDPAQGGFGQSNRNVVPYITSGHGVVVDRTGMSGNPENVWVKRSTMNPGAVMLASGPTDGDVIGWLGWGGVLKMIPR